ncbi:MAG: AAA family ATPase, partial [Gammaproteobacteria bacterium]|nr:AAA family ATPase [Gammaproteobacteria bacterium]
MMDTATLAEALGGHKNGDNWIACCPAHDDKNPSLSVSNGSDERVLVHCHAGCPQEAVIAALRDRGLWSSGADAMTKPQPPQEQWTPITPVPDDAPPPYPTHFKFGRPTMRWTYRDANAKQLMYVDRFDSPSEDKQFLPLTFCIDSEGNRKWRWKSLPDPRPLFGLEKLTKADPSTPVIVVEGEKCATALRSLGFVAVTSQNGSAAVNKTDWAPLSGRKTVVVFPDNDNSGEKYARAVFQALKVLNNPPDALLAHLPNLPDKGDVIDWLQAQLRSWDGYASITGPDRQRLQRLLWEAIKGCAVKPPKQWIGKTGIRDSVKEQQEWKNAKGHAQSSAVIVCAADVKPEKIQWHWPGRIALGKVSILVGDPGLGKSLVTIAMAAHTSLGNAWPVDHSPCPIGDVILLSGEDDIADTIRPRLDAAGADVKRVHILKMVEEVNRETSSPVSRG